MKQLATLILSLALFAIPTVALADFHGPNDVRSLDRDKEAVQVNVTSAEKKVLQTEDTFDLQSRREETIG